MRKNAEGNVIYDSRSAETKPQPGSAVWSGPLAPHSVTNLGDADIRVISVELKD